MSGTVPTRAWADTNVCIALFAGPTHSTHELALAIFRRVAEGQLELIVTPVIVAEVIYVLRSVLGWSRPETAERLGAFLVADGLAVREGPELLRALELMQKRPIDFADAYLAAQALDPGPPVVGSFDRDFDGIEGLRRITG